ncbi:WcaF family extracellular polysaccharide biosynthesis acetyltransferase [Spirosoma sp. SC4-14]|uniref:WcaF family extracellular polysaccharide biosynthesis acetyltransferase n=1 Tax=Spirosoma sp. SC4-14 TaxID=3128900 RepID=UPI0030D01396
MAKTSAQAIGPEQIERKTDLSVYDISWYKPGPRWKIIVWFMVNAVLINSYLPLPMVFKRFILKLFGAKMGKGVVIKPGVNIKYPWFLELGNYVWIGEKVWIDNLSQVVIGDHSCLSQGAMILTGNHDYRRSTFDLTTRPITLDDGVWIGAKAIVCAGVRCHSHAVLSVNSVATRDLEEYGIYQGNPAILVRKRIIRA